MRHTGLYIVSPWYPHVAREHKPKFNLQTPLHFPLFPPLPDHDNINNDIIVIDGNRDPACSTEWRTYQVARASPPLEETQRHPGVTETILVEEG